MKDLLKETSYKIKNVRKTLEEKYGGKWTKIPGYCMWECDDGRQVWRVSAGVDEFDNPLGPGRLCLYHPRGSKKPSEWVNL